MFIKITVWKIIFLAWCFLFSVVYVLLNILQHFNVIRIVPVCKNIAIVIQCFREQFTRLLYLIGTLRCVREFSRKEMNMCVCVCLRRVRIRYAQLKQGR